MDKFYIVMLVLLIIAVINTARALKEHDSSSKRFGVAINVIGIVLIATALVARLLQ